jgi:hypothetical protein
VINLIKKFPSIMNCELEITFKKKTKKASKLINRKKKKKQLGIFKGGRSYSTQVKYFLRVWPFTGKVSGCPSKFYKREELEPNFSAMTKGPNHRF